MKTSIKVLAASVAIMASSLAVAADAAATAKTASASTPSTVASTKKVNDKLLVKARNAFAAGNVQAAIKNYRSFIATNPSSIDAHGELGNVFYAVGARQEAAQAYFQAASLAIAQNRLELAEELMPVVIEGNPMLADQLDDKLIGAQAKTDEEWRRKADEEMRTFMQDKKS